MRQVALKLTEKTLGLVIETAMQLPHDGSVMVTFANAKEKRSLAQNALYWGAWLPALSRGTGITVDSLHDKFKKKYMTRIYLAGQDNKMQGNWVMLYLGALELLKEGVTDEKLKNRDRAVNVITTTWSSVQQFTTFLEYIEHECIDEYHRGNVDWQLPASKHYREAMGR